jgi:hypothetical protein
MPDEEQAATMPEEQQSATQAPAQPHQEGTPVVVPHIEFGEPTGNPLVAVRKGYGLTPLHSRDESTEPAEVADN